MMSTNTLTSLAILKVHIDQGKDYLDYLRPFILQILIEHNPNPITDGVVRHYIRERFGLEIPELTVQIVLKRICRRYSLKRDHGRYQITGDLPDPQITAKQSHAERHIAAVLGGLRRFSQGTIKPICSDKEAIVAICTFLAKFDVACLRAYLRGTAIPSLEKTAQADIVLVSEYVQHVQQNDPERFDSFLILVQGHMGFSQCSNVPRSRQNQKNYQGVTFFLDTPLLVRRLGAEGKAKQDATRELISLLSNLGGEVTAFSHSREELQRVLQGAANHLERPHSRGAIGLEARKRGTTRSDLLLLAESIDDKLIEAGIEVKDTPRYVERFQIDEMAFEHILEDGVSYYNPRAREYDINSVRSIYIIRGNTPAPSVEKARAVFVTSNAAFAKAAWEYGKDHEASKNVSSVIADFSLANMAWLKAPVGAAAIPTTQLLAFSYAALEPSKELLGKYMKEIDRLESQGTITERDHQLLRSSPRAYEELMHLTLGEDAALTTKTVTQMLERVTNEIKKEVSKRLTEEQAAHQETRTTLSSQKDRHQRIISNLFWRCRREAGVVAWILSAVIGSCAHWLTCCSWIGTEFGQSHPSLGTQDKCYRVSPTDAGESCGGLYCKTPPSVGAESVLGLVSQASGEGHCDRPG